MTNLTNLFFAQHMFRMHSGTCCEAKRVFSTEKKSALPEKCRCCFFPLLPSFHNTNEVINGGGQWKPSLRFEVEMIVLSGSERSSNPHHTCCRNTWSLTELPLQVPVDLHICMRIFSDDEMGFFPPPPLLVLLLLKMKIQLGPYWIMRSKAF